MNTITGGCQTAKQESEIMIQVDKIDRGLSMIQDRANVLAGRISQILSPPQVATNNKVESPTDVRSEMGQQLQNFNNRLQDMLATIDDTIDRVRI
jgi:hypothetical protein